MSHRPTRHKYAVFQQACQLIPAFLVARLARQYGVDKKARTFSPWSHVVALIYAHFTHALSLNDVCDSLKSHRAKLLTVRDATPPSKNTFSYANRNRDARMAKALFWETFEHLKSTWPAFGARRQGAVMPRRFKRTIAVVDSSVIHLVANCMDWASHRRRKAAAKLHLSLDLQSFLPRFAVVDSARKSDKTHARSVCANLKGGEIAVFDRAYIDYTHFDELTGRDVFWVSRTIKTMACRCVKHLIKKPEGKILSDQLVVLTGPLSKKKYPRRLRVVRALVEVKGVEREMTFMTNNLEWAPSSICDLYKSRWAIETFFKEIKQTLQLSDFLGYNRNAIAWQIWTALLLYVLVRFLAFIHHWSNGFKRLFCLLRSCAWDTYAIDALLKTCGTAGGIPRLRASPQQAWLPGFGP